MWALNNTNTDAANGHTLLSLAEEELMIMENTTMNNSTSYYDDDNGLEEDEDDYYQADTLALILPRITAVISLFAVVCVALEAYNDIVASRDQNFTTRSNRVRSSKNSSSTTITRIQFFYQLPLFCHALAFALGTTPAPSNLNVWGAAGTTATCEAQGFLLQFGIFGNVGWDVVLSTAYLLMVRYNVSSTRLLNMEKYYHIIIWPIVLILCIYPLVMDMFNINHSVCWLESLPNDCVGDECERGAGAPLMQTIASGLGVLHLLYSIGIMLSIYCAIRGLENRNTRYGVSSLSLDTNDNPAEPNRRYSRAVAIQGMLYASGMILCTLPTAAYIIVYNGTGLWSPGFGIFATSLTPLMGYVNFCIFIRGRSIDDCKTTYGKFLRKLHSCLFDYKLVCECKIRCVSVHDDDGDDLEAQQQPQNKKQRRKKKKKLQQQDVASNAETAPTAPTTGSSSSKTNKESNDGTKQGDSHARKQEQHQQEHSYQDSTEDSEGQRHRRLTGFWIQKKSKASLVSDLEGSESDYLDLSPAKPVRIRSQAENPPHQPQRFVSDLDDLNGDDDSSSDEEEEESVLEEQQRFSGTTLWSKKKPVLASDLDSSPMKPTRIRSQAETPSLPTQVVSELTDNDDDDDDEESTTEVFDLSPSCDILAKEEEEVQRRCLNPPTIPQRFQSELLDVSAESHPPPPAALRLSATTAAAFASQTNHNKHATAATGKAPPIQPIRFESEVPRNEEEDDDNSVSEVSYPDELGNENTTTATKGNCKAPPAKPIRYASEVPEEEP